MNFIEEKGPHLNVNVKKELQQMLVDSSVWGSCQMKILYEIIMLSLKK